MEDPSETDYDYDVVVSYAGEDRAYVTTVVERLKVGGVRVFYDQDELATMWGENLVDFLQAVYKRRARYAILFVSKAYVEKKWTSHERQAAQDRALQQASSYILPVKLDDVELPGLHSTVAYLDVRHIGLDALVLAVLAKIGHQDADAKPAKFNGRVPRNAEEVGVLLTERPDAWEYLLFGSALRTGIDELEDRYRDFELQYAPAAGPALASPSDGTAYIQERMATASAISAQVERLLAPKAQEAAFGVPGEPGDADRIIHLASRLIRLYSDLLDWAAEVHGVRTSDDSLSDLMFVVARYVEQPLVSIREFVADLVAELDTVTEKIERGEDVSITLELKWIVPEVVSGHFDRVLEEFIRRNEL